MRYLRSNCWVRLVTPESLLLCVEALGACRPVDVDGVGSELLRVLPGGLVVGVAKPLHRRRWVGTVP